jgi:hypothetical protein
VDWLKDNSYLAEWFAIPVAVAIAYVTVKDKTLPQIDWTMLLMRTAFAVSLAVVLTEGHSQGVRTSAQVLCFTLAGALLVGGNRR